MKLKPHTYKAWWDLHAWAGLLCSLVVYVFFFFGSVTLFHSELSIWQEPHAAAPSLPEVDHILDRKIADGSISRVSLRLNFPRQRSPWFSIGYTDADGTEQHRYIEKSGLAEPRSNVADFFYGMHYLQFPGAPEWLYTLTGVFSGVLLLVVVTGVLIHLRDIVRHFHQFRPHKKLQVLWSDSHKVLGTIGLPFAAVYAFTGTWMGLDGVLSSRLATAGFHGDAAALARAMNGSAPAPDLEPSHVPASRLPLAELLARAEAARPPPDQSATTSRDCRSVYLNDIGDRDATALFYCGNHDVLLRQRDGFLIPSPLPNAPTLASRISDVPYAMHFVEFAEVPLRALYVVLGLAGCLAILTGNWLWLARRTPTRATWLVQRLTLAVGAGSLLASALMLLASRFAVSAAFERHVFWWSWLAAAGASLLGRDATALWRWLGMLGGGIIAVSALPGMVGAFGSAPPLIRATSRTVDVVLLASGLVLALWARRLRRPDSKTTKHLTPSLRAEPVDVG